MCRESVIKTIDNKLLKTPIKNKENRSAERYNCPPELILLHCSHCNDSFEKPARKRLILCERCSNPYQLQCAKCRKIFRKYMTLYCHIKAICGNANPEIQPKDGRVECPDCGTKFSSYENLKRHKRLTCRKQAVFKCASCSFVSKYKASLELHEKTQHCSVSTEYRCKWCSKKYRHAQTLKRHETYNCGKEKSFFCGHCDYKCYLKYQLRTHMRTKHQRLFFRKRTATAATNTAAAAAAAAVAEDDDKTTEK